LGNAGKVGMEKVQGDVRKKSYKSWGPIDGSQMMYFAFQFGTGVAIKPDNVRG